MNRDRAWALALRQQQLLARSAQLRGRVATEVAPWKQRLALVDRLRSAVGTGWRWLRRHPEVPAGLAVAVVVLRPRRAWRFGWRWGRRAWLGWQIYRRVRAGSAPLRQPLGLGAARLGPVAASLARGAVELARRWWARP